MVPSFLPWEYGNLTITHIASLYNYSQGLKQADREWEMESWKLMRREGKSACSQRDERMEPVWTFSIETGFLKETVST